jgi:predicted O-methyltransferase YrrM
MLIEGIANMVLRRLIYKEANIREYGFIIPENIYHPHLDDANFLRSLAIAAPYSIISTCKFQSLYWALQESPLGDVLDIGVLRGGSSLFFASLLTDNQKLHSVDNWSDHSKPKSDSTQTYSSSKDLQQYRDAIKTYGLNKKITLYDSSLREFQKKFVNEISETISLIHFDLFSEIVFDDSIEDLLFVLKKGGAILIGGYGALSLPKLSKSVNQFANKNRHLVRFFQDKCGYGVFIKLV